MKTNKSCIWEDYPIEIRKNYKLNIYNDNSYKCKHIKDGMIPIVVIGTNEGGYNSVGMCGECLLEIINKEL